ncbi:MAG: hypothetical protein PHY93_09990 [Bacteriovorax sp.]|nr:hypothetical protein [Bacteriovorax sp.]
MNHKDIIHATRFKAQQRSFKAYLFIMSLPVFLYHSLATKDYWTLLFISCLALYAPILWAAFVIYLCLKTHIQFKRNIITEKENVQCDVVNSLQMNQLQKLSEAIDANPDILYCDYQRRSLIAWCRYYKNTRAQELIIQLMKKYPKQALAA